MIEVVVINKNGVLSTKRVNDINQDEINRLYNKNVTTPVNHLHTWKLANDKKKELVVFGSTSGNAGNENMYELPPPMDNLLLFGNIIIVGIYNFSKDK